MKGERERRERGERGGERERERENEREEAEVEREKHTDVVTHDDGDFVSLSLDLCYFIVRHGCNEG